MAAVSPRRLLAKPMAACIALVARTLNSTPACLLLVTAFAAFPVFTYPSISDTLSHLSRSPFFSSRWDRRHSLGPGEFFSSLPLNEPDIVHSPLRLLVLPAPFIPHKPSVSLQYRDKVSLSHEPKRRQLIIAFRHVHQCDAHEIRSHHQCHPSHTYLHGMRVYHRPSSRSRTFPP
jgi:hypothetical protein